MRKYWGFSVVFIFMALLIASCGGGGGTTTTPTSAVCGNGTVETGEQCDDGNTTTEACTYGQTSCTVCNASCQNVSGSTSYCGDSTTDSGNGEQCDDGNTTSGDGCSSTCQNEISKIVFHTWVSSGNRKIVKIDSDGTGKTDLTDTTYDDYGPEWSPDGTNIAFCSKRTGDNNNSFYVMDDDGANVTKLKEISGEECDGIEWSPNGDKFAISTSLGMTSPYYKLYVMNTNGSGLLYLADGQSIMWNSDGTKIFFNDRSDSMKLKSINVDGTGATTVSDTSLYLHEISPGGSSLIFVGFDVPASKISGETTDKSGLFYGNVDLSGNYNLIHETIQGVSYEYYGDWGASWSGDGSQLVYDKITPTEHAIYISNLDGTGQTLLSEDAVDPAWYK